MGYKSMITPDYIISANTTPIEVEMEEDTRQLATITVKPDVLRRTGESPVGIHVIGLQEIEKNPGSNRDISRIVRSYPGVSFSPIGYRNDLIVRGGGPSENRFYMDGIEIPNINHFSTQGASGGPTSIVNADLIREIKFYTGAFPANRSGALSSVLDFTLQNGNTEKQTFKATLGASEVSFSGSGHFSPRTTYLFSVRQSYLQFLFKMLGLPFLPNYIDGQVKIKSRLKNNDELMFLGLTGIDKMKLNTDQKGESAEYLLSYLPRINQETYTVGASYRHFSERNILALYLSHNYLNNRNTKYVNNDESSTDNLRSRLRSTEQKTTFRIENSTQWQRWTLKEGVEGNLHQYTNSSLQRLFVDTLFTSHYRTDLNLWAYGAFVLANFTSDDNRLTLSLGARTDAAAYGKLRNPLHQISPRFSLKYNISDYWSFGGNAGLYYQLPPYTALGYKNNSGQFVNKQLRYMRVAESSLGFDWRPAEQLVFSIEGFYKYYTNVPLSLTDSVPLTCKGNDYGVTGDEALSSSAQGRSYGVELTARWQRDGRFNLTGSFTLYRSEYRNDSHSNYIASAWDNRFILNVSGTYNFPHEWSLGGKLSFIGGSPYTPYDEKKSLLVQAWNAKGRPYYDYSRYNEKRLDNFAQLDVRVDKDFYFKTCRLGFYVDLQNVTMSKLRQQDVLLSNGIVENPEAPIAEQRYGKKYLKQSSGTLVPTLGITVEF